MDKAYFEDANGRKGVAFLAVVATEEILQAVEQKTPTSKVLEAVKQIRALPQVNSETLDYHENEYLITLAHAENSSVLGPAYVMTMAQDLERNMPAGRLRLTMAEAQKTICNESIAEAISVVARHHAVMQSRPSEIKKFIKQNVVLKCFSPVDDFAQNDAFAVFCRLKFRGSVEEGYVVDKDGHLGPLSRALLFESMPAVEHAVKRWRNTFDGLPHVQVVNLKMQVTSLGPVLPTLGAAGYNASNNDLDNSVIHEIGAKMQRKAIEQALEDASVEQIEQALARKSHQVKRKM